MTTDAERPVGPEGRTEASDPPVPPVPAEGARPVGARPEEEPGGPTHPGTTSDRVEAPERRGFADDPWARFVAIVAAALVGGLVRGWQVRGRPPSWWQDSTDYLTVGSSGWEVLTGSRPPLVSWLVHATGGEPGTTFVTVNVLVAAIAWGWLAVEVATEMPTRARRVLGAIVILAFSLVTPIAHWDRSVLSESLSASLLAAFVAAGIWCLRRPGLLRVAAFVVAALAWLSVRDSNAAVLVAIAVGCVVAWVLARRAGRHRPLALVAAAGLVVVVALSLVSSTAGDRESLPTAHVLMARVLPHPDRVEWFIDRGMPDAERWRTAAANATGDPPFVGVGRDDPTAAEWWEWVRDDGRQALWLYMATHPGYLVTEPLADPERTFNNAEGDLLGYKAADMPVVPFTSELLWWPTPLVLAVATGVGVWWWRAGRPRSRLVEVGATCLGTSGLLAFAAWHLDGMETARHLYVAAVGSRLGTLLGVLGVVAALAPHVTRAAPVDASPHAPEAPDGDDGTPVVRTDR